MLKGVQKNKRNVQRCAKVCLTCNVVQNFDICAKVCKMCKTMQNMQSCALADRADRAGQAPIAQSLKLSPTYPTWGILVNMVMLQNW